MTHKKKHGKKKRPITNTPKGFKDEKKSKEAAPEEAKKKEEEVQSSEISTKRKNDEIFNENPTPEKKNHLQFTRNSKYKLIMISTVLGILFLILIFKPQILGLGVYDQADLNDTLSELSNLQEIPGIQGSAITNLEQSIKELRLEMNNKNDQLSEFLEKDVSRITGDLVSCMIEKDSLEDAYGQSILSLENELEKKKQELEVAKSGQDSDLSDTKTELDLIKAKLDALASNAAHSICCKKKVDNFDINYYDIVNDKIVCLEEGNKSLSCFS